MNVPNALTIFRIILVPVFLYFAINDYLQASVAVFAVAAFTDAADGFIARRYDLKTEFGRKADPFADKLLMVSAYLALSFKGLIPFWLMLPVVLRDVSFFVLFLYLKGTERTVKVKTSWSGKATTVLQVASVLYALLIAGGDWFFFIIAGLTLLFTVYTWVDYFVKESRLQRG
ncbi:MAG: CDP-alcohol phosphatidyltransferase family protein [Deltaproteobacteria bacterium]|nr:CDP-alcohol phosphatidyltransferase family protein [Deltaproteobacteria bacterium]